MKSTFVNVSQFKNRILPSLFVELPCVEAASRRNELPRRKQLLAWFELAFNVNGFLLYLGKGATHLFFFIKHKPFCLTQSKALGWGMEEKQPKQKARLELA